MKIVKFYKNTCPHCKVFDPLYKEMKDKYGEQIDFYEVNLDDAPHFKEIFGMKYVPCVYQFESEDFVTITKKSPLDIGHSKNGYPLFEKSLKDLMENS